MTYLITHDLTLNRPINNSYYTKTKSSNVGLVVTIQNARRFIAFEV